MFMVSSVTYYMKLHNKFFVWIYYLTNKVHIGTPFIPTIAAHYNFDTPW